MKKLMLLACLMMFQSAFAGTTGGGAGYIKSITIKETGHIFVTLESNHANPPGCSEAHIIVIKNDHPAQNKILSVLLSAQAQKKKTLYWLNGLCHDQYGKSYPTALTAGITNDL